jgi:hypothetical protein
MLHILILVSVGLLVLYFMLKWFALRGSLPGLSPPLSVGNLIQTGVLFNSRSLVQVYLSFRERFGDIFQIWLDPWRFIVVGNVNDVQHIFTHRNIYDQSDFLVRQFGVFLPDELITLKGTFHCFDKH